MFIFWWANPKLKIWQHMVIDILSRHKSAKYHSFWIKNKDYMHNFIQLPSRIIAHFYPRPPVRPPPFAPASPPPPPPPQFSAFRYMLYIFWASITPELHKISSSNFQHFLVVRRPTKCMKGLCPSCKGFKVGIFRIRHIHVLLMHGFAVLRICIPEPS